MKLSFKEQSTRSFLKFLLAPLIINFIIELCSRRSLGDTFSYIFGSPLVFLYNCLIILSTLSIVLLFKRRTFFFTLISTIWIGFGITNGIILSNRVTPFTATDLTLADLGLGMISKYLSATVTNLIAGFLIAVVLGIIFLFFKGPKYKGKLNYKKNILIVTSVWAFLFLSTKVALGFNVITSYFGNIAFAYEDYGFPYCFSNTLLNTGIDKPKDYSEEKIASISDLIASNNTSNELGSNDILLASTEGGLNHKTNTDKPNIVMVQLESFFDPTLVKYLQFSEDPVPNFRSLMENYSSGYLTVPSVGAGTANTEFEVLSGMSLQFFGPGEYPYKTILQESTAESVSYDLKELGYSTHAIHNNKGTFYGRNFVFSQLGFDTFTSLEYMNVEEYTPKDWAKDFYLTDEILKSLNSTEGSDFVYTISVQAHGDYPKEKILENPKIQVSGLPDEETTNAFTYYINQLHEVDQFVGQLVEALSNRDEETVLVLFGDHLPTLGFSDEDLVNNSIFQTEYVVWSNFDMPKNDQDLTAYQLTSSVLNSLDIDNGVLTKFHNQFKNTPNYLDDLKLLQYDMLYGEQYIYGGINPFIATDLKMGTYDISITDVYEETTTAEEIETLENIEPSEDSETIEGIDELEGDNNLVIKGENFNEFSKIYINGKYTKTVFIDSNTLMVNDITLEPNSSIVVTQRTTGGGKLSSTNEFIYPIVDEQ
ncbi:LTA synthase family protein [uncultured Clostridium sp.]|uniref:LTA synthase family protein n=1 Tax=uncultured Clostridium sp. TaxID=59620 RepID=UPI0025DB53C7|nr:LTA synthase family protein [uncultured Clostridium sp.]MDU4884889.1 LTA synthase family protein [Clostridium celatum]MDU7078093.1 LTA synthase family protein [Clostridium celatum]